MRRINKMNLQLNFLFAVATGGLIALQGAINSQLGKQLADPLHAAFVSFGIGTLGLWLIILAMRSGLPSFAQITSLPPVLLIGGLLGAAYISVSIMVIPKIGVANLLIAALVGQILVSIALDHFGIFGVPVKVIGYSRVLGAGFVIVGLVFISK